MKRKFVALLILLGLFYTVTGYAGVEDAKAAYDKGDYVKALQEAMPLAQHGSADAQKLLGVMYANGQGLPKDYTKAIEWFSKAAEQGHAGAQRNLGLMYVNGLGVPQDFKKAAELFRKAAEQGNADAQVGLGFMYVNGNGVPQDYAQAIEWYRKAAAQGDAGAQFNLGFMYYTGQGVPKDYAQAVEWYRKAAEQGSAMAQNNLGRMYEYGLGVPKDNAKAIEWYRKADKQGLEKAHDNLRVLLSAASDISETMTAMELKKECVHWSKTCQSFLDQVYDWMLANESTVGPLCDPVREGHATNSAGKPIIGRSSADDLNNFFVSHIGNQVWFPKASAKDATIWMLQVQFQCTVDQPILDPGTPGFPNRPHI